MICMLSAAFKMSAIKNIVYQTKLIISGSNSKLNDYKIIPVIKATFPVRFPMEAAILFTSTAQFILK